MNKNKFVAFTQLRPGVWIRQHASGACAVIFGDPRKKNARVISLDEKSFSEQCWAYEKYGLRREDLLIHATEGEGGTVLLPKQGGKLT